MKITVFVFSLLLSQGVLAEIISYTGKYKVHEDRCYEQIEKNGSKTHHWEEFDCIRYLEDMHINENILNLMYTYHQLMQSGKVSKDAYAEIVDASMSALGQKSYFNDKTIMQNLVDAIKTAQSKYPVK